MNATKKRLLCLNLALVMALLLALPISASANTIETSGDVQQNESPSPPPHITDTADFRTDSMASYYSTAKAGQPYDIYVDDVKISSDTDASGNGWSYTAAENTLLLKNYNGGEIYSYGDLTVVSSGTATVEPVSLNDGIYAAGNLNILIMDGKLMVYGASSGSAPTFAAAAKGDLQCHSYDGASAYFSGGSTDGEGVLGGDALCSHNGNITLSGSNINVLGGSSELYYGGFGIYTSKSVYLDADNCTVIGGASEYGYGCGISGKSIYITGDNFWIDGDYGTYSSSLSISGNRGEIHGSTYGICCDNVSIYGSTTVESDQVGIYFAKSCRIGPALTTISGAKYAFRWPEAVSAPTYDSHLTLSGNSLSYTFTPKQYTLILRDDDGVITVGSTMTTLKAYYPTSYQLGLYLFKFPGYVQVAWEDGPYTVYPLDTEFLPQSDYFLSTMWLKADPGDIVLNGLSGTFEDENFYQKHSTDSVTLPDSLTYTDPNTHLMAWCTEVVSTPDKLTQIYGGQWYACGETVSATNDTSVYYGRAYNGGAYAIYDPTEGSVAAGGSIIVQGTDVTWSDLVVYAPGEDEVVAPEGKILLGWSTEEDSNEVTYAPGEPILLPKKTITRLYACWLTVVEADEGLTLSRLPGADTIHVNASAEWCETTDAETVVCAIYDVNGKMLTCRMVSTTGGSLQFDVPYHADAHSCIIFGLDENYAPTCDAVSCEIP